MIMVSDIDSAPTADVVEKEQYDRLKERYDRMRENAAIMAKALKEIEE